MVRGDPAKPQRLALAARLWGILRVVRELVQVEVGSDLKSDSQLKVGTI